MYSGVFPSVQGLAPFGFALSSFTPSVGGYELQTAASPWFVSTMVHAHASSIPWVFELIACFSCTSVQAISDLQVLLPHYSAIWGISSPPTVTQTSAPGSILLVPATEVSLDHALFENGY
jgi:hypothetical protein